MLQKRKKNSKDSHDRVHEQKIFRRALSQEESEEKKQSMVEKKINEFEDGGWFSDKPNLHILFYK